jgi:hypothetical protein
MNRTLIFLIFASLAYIQGFAQDVVTMKSGEILNVKVIRFDLESIMYTGQDVADTITLTKDKLSKVQLQNGILIDYTANPDKKINADSSFNSMYQLGMKDSKKYYKGYVVPSILTGISAPLFPFNLIPAVTFSAITPRNNNLGYRDKELMQNIAYKQGYVKQAHKTKAKYVIGSFAISTTLFVGIALALGGFGYGM